MVTTVSEAPLLSSEIIDRGLADKTQLLRTFERLRRDLSIRIEGDEGMFAGFDRLHLMHGAEVPDLPVFVQVSMSRRLEGSHCVDFVALAFEPDREHSPLNRGHVVVVGQGHGRTMRLQPED